MAIDTITVTLSMGDFTKKYLFGAIEHIVVGDVSAITVFGKPIYYRSGNVWQFLWLIAGDK